MTTTSGETATETKATRPTEKSAVLVQCPHCYHVAVTIFKTEKIDLNLLLGSKQAPLRTYCQSPTLCRPKNYSTHLGTQRQVKQSSSRLQNSCFNAHSNQRDCIWAEVPMSKPSQVYSLRQVAIAVNIGQEKPTKAEAKRLWKMEVGYESTMPFKRWEKRGGV